MKKHISLFLALVIAMGTFAACGGDGGEVPLDDSSDVSEPQVQELKINLLTGEEAAPGYDPMLRPTAIMVNNYAKALPQRGIGDAEIMYEMVTEAGITRLMCVYSDYEEMPYVGPIRSARDQMVQLVIPMGMIYLHVGESIYARQMLDYYGWGVHEIDFKYYSNYLWFDADRHNSGISTEHCWFVNGEAIANAAEKAGIITEAERKIPLFNFVPYDEEQRVLTDGDSTSISVRFASGYVSGFDYRDGRYYKTYNGAAHIDANDGTQVSFDNVFVLFTTIENYPGTMLANISYSFGGAGYYFNGGRYEKIRWLKGVATESLRIVDMGGNEIDVEINPGNSYIAVVSLDEAEAFTY